MRGLAMRLFQHRQRVHQSYSTFRTGTTRTRLPCQCRTALQPTESLLLIGRFRCWFAKSFVLVVELCELFIRLSELGQSGSARQRRGFVGGSNGFIELAVLGVSCG